MTPVIIKEVLGQEIYDLFEEVRKVKQDRTIHILTSAEGKRLLEEEIIKEARCDT